MMHFESVQPSIEYKNQYEKMMNEWENFGGRLNPGALRRYCYSQKRIVSYEEWLNWIDEDKRAGQELYFFINEQRILGAISLRPKKDANHIGTDGHIGYGIRPSERRKGYATIMLSMALPILKRHGINPVVISCDKDNTGSAKTILNNNGTLVEEIADKASGNILQIYQIQL